MRFDRKDEESKYRIIRFIVIMILILSLAQNVNFYLKYNRLQDLYIECSTNPNTNSLEQRLRDRREGNGNTRDVLQYNEVINSDNPEFNKVNEEVIKDIESKLDRIKTLETK